MKQSLLFTLFAAFSIAFLFFGNSSGPGQVQGIDRTGSPLSPGACNASGCHDDGAFNPTVEASLLDGTETVTNYEPGKTYTFRFTITAGTGEPGAYGFQAVALTGDDDQQAGSWGDLPSGLQVTTLSNRDYVEHSEPNSENTFEIPWTAPQTEAGNIRFYAAGNAVNRNGASSGDGALPLSEPLTVTPLTSGIFGVEKLAVQLSAFPNPVQDKLQLDIEGAEAGAYQLSLVDLHGRVIAQRALQLQSAAQRESFDFAALPGGHYFVRLSDGRRVAGLKVVKE